MFVRCSDIINIMEEYAKPTYAENWDNIGLMVGDENSIIKKILIALDITDDVIEEAINKNCNMIITHHPFIFKDIKSIKSSDVLGKRIIKLIENKINVYSAHTNLDVAKNGTNDTFANLLGLKNIENLFPPKAEEKYGLGRTGELDKSIKFSEFIKKVKKAIGLEKLVVCGELDANIKKIGICTGSGGEVDFISQAIKTKCDVYITGDLKYHNSQFGKDLGICLIDATHYASEVIVVPTICDYINKCAKRLNMNIECIESEIDGQILKII